MLYFHSQAQLSLHPSCANVLVFMAEKTMLGYHIVEDEDDESYTETKLRYWSTVKRRSLETLLMEKLMNKKHGICYDNYLMVCCICIRMV
jgi:hypothetical protein